MGFSSTDIFHHSTSVRPDIMFDDCVAWRSTVGWSQEKEGELNTGGEGISVSNTESLCSFFSYDRDKEVVEKPSTLACSLLRPTPSRYVHDNEAIIMYSNHEQGKIILAVIDIRYYVQRRLTRRSADLRTT
jgi:hypothetical protein